MPRPAKRQPDFNSNQPTLEGLSEFEVAPPKVPNRRVEQAGENAANLLERGRRQSRVLRRITGRDQFPPSNPAPDESTTERWGELDTDETFVPDVPAQRPMPAEEMTADPDGADLSEDDHLRPYRLRPFRTQRRIDVDGLAITRPIAEAAARRAAERRAAAAGETPPADY